LGFPVSGAIDVFALEVDPEPVSGSPCFGMPRVHHGTEGGIVQFAGVGLTLLVGVAPAIANAVHHATGKRARTLPIRIDDLI
jgi:hypothetical protein